MFNLLPQSEKQNILKEYATRRNILIVMFVFALGVISVVALIPAYLLSTIKLNEVNDELVRVKGSVAFQESDNLNKILIDTNAKLASVKATKDQVYVADLIKNVISKQDLNIRINGIMYKRGSAGAMSVITLAGIAHNREQLSSFVQDLRSLPLFTSVNLPVSSFAKDKNAEFSIQIQGAF
jgi:Tfp pilus assembly protein PilN